MPKSVIAGSYDKRMFNFVSISQTIILQSVCPTLCSYQRCLIGGIQFLSTPNIWCSHCFSV